MSGIFGIYNRDNKPVDRNDLNAMAASLQHRGKDGQGIWLNRSIGIGHQMFHSTPEAMHEKLPYTDTESNISISCDVRLDNRDELITQLECQKINKVITDSYLILQSYKKWGTECPQHLLGDFVFVIWDERNKKIFCARDHMGIKPFSYYLSDNQFAFASEAKAVLADSRVPQNINEGRIADFLLDLEGIDKTSTFYEQIYRLPPAHTMVVTEDSVSIDCYWKLDPKKEIILNSDEEYIEAFSAIYTDAIEKRLRSNDDAASMLSGGIDSSSIVAIAKELYKSKTGRNFPVFSATSANSEYSDIETSFINIGVQMENIDSHVIDSKNISAFNDEINQVAASLPEPFDLMVMIIAVYLLANQSGYRIVLDGIDGDLIYSLSHRYPAYFVRKGQWLKAIREIKGQATNSYLHESPLHTLLIKNFGALIPRSLKQLIREIIRPSSLDAQIKDTLISRKFAKRIIISERIKRYNRHADNSVCFSLKDLQINSIEHPNLTVALERYDRVAARCSIEPRHPLLDKRLVEFMVAIPWNQKTRNGYTKFLLKKSSERILPREICWRQSHEHVGWDFEKLWLENNRNKVLREIELKTNKIGAYIDAKKTYRRSNKMINRNNGDDNLIASLRKLYLLLKMG